MGQIHQTPSFEGRRKALLKEDEVQTILVEVEAVLNSRSLVADSSNPQASAPPHLDTIYNAGSLYQASNDGFGETGPVTM